MRSSGRFTALLLLFALLLAACSGPEAAAPAPAGDQAPAPGSSGKPQLIEFYADW